MPLRNKLDAPGPRGRGPCSPAPTSSTRTTAAPGCSSPRPPARRAPRVVGAHVPRRPATRSSAASGVRRAAAPERVSGARCCGSCTGYLRIEALLSLLREPWSSRRRRSRTTWSQHGFPREALHVIRTGSRCAAASLRRRTSRRGRHRGPAPAAQGDRRPARGERPPGDAGMRLVIYGDGPLRAELEAAGARPRPRRDFPGIVPDAARQLARAGRVRAPEPRREPADRDPRGDGRGAARGRDARRRRAGGGRGRRDRAARRARRTRQPLAAALDALSTSDEASRAGARGRKARRDADRSSTSPPHGRRVRAGMTARAVPSTGSPMRVLHVIQELAHGRRRAGRRRRWRRGAQAAGRRGRGRARRASSTPSSTARTTRCRSSSGGAEPRCPAATFAVAGAVRRFRAGHRARAQPGHRGCRRPGDAPRPPPARRSSASTACPRRTTGGRAPAPAARAAGRRVRPRRRARRSRAGVPEPTRRS